MHQQIPSLPAFDNLVHPGGACEHPCVVPDFDERAAEGMTSDQVRERWPRYHGRCPDCGFYGALYASFKHYLAGDW